MTGSMGPKGIPWSSATKLFIAMTAQQENRTCWKQMKYYLHACKSHMNTDFKLIISYNTTAAIRIYQT